MQAGSPYGLEGLEAARPLRGLRTLLGLPSRGREGAVLGPTCVHAEASPCVLVQSLAGLSRGLLPAVLYVSRDGKWGGWSVLKGEGFRDACR